ncbi:MAG: lipase secretion chaperone [Acidobacteriota bacterium]
MKLYSSTRSGWIWLAGLSVVVAGGAWLGPRLLPVDGEGVTLAARHGWSLLGAGNEVEPTRSPVAGSAGTRTLSSIRASVFGDALLSQTQAAGDWGVGADGKLHPDLALRKRFEYYLLALGSASPTELRALIEDEARRAHGDKAAAEIMAIYDKYWALRSHQPSRRLVLNERETWEPAFLELKGLRRQYLGPVWADAFYKDEEAEFLNFVAQADGKAGPDKADMNMPVPQMGPGKDAQAVHAERVALYGEAAAQRLAQADAEWADWERRLAAARAEYQRVQASPELSDVQRQQAIDQYIQSHFPPDERLRARGLLN